MLPLVLDELVRRARGFKGEIWTLCEPEASELAAAEQEATTGAQFDKMGLKQTVWTGYKQGSVKLVCRRLGELARVLVFLPAGQKEPNWEFWSKVFHWFGPSKEGPWRVTLFASHKRREFPDEGQDLGPEHVNGGYTISCSAQGIFIYRAEEATRVLIHEMMHAACMDEPTWTVEQREAMVETWAELILIALLSKGSKLTAEKLWKAQSHWIADTNWKAKHHHNTHDSTDYAWRYLCGREEMYQRLGVALPSPRSARAINSVRFTHPMLEI